MVNWHSKKQIVWWCIVDFFFYQGFLSQTLMIHRTAGEGRGPSFIPFYHFHLLTNSFLSYWKLQLVIYTSHFMTSWLFYSQLPLSILQVCPKRRKIAKICTSQEPKEYNRWTKKHFHNFFMGFVLVKYTKIVETSFIKYHFWSIVLLLYHSLQKGINLFLEYFPFLIGHIPENKNFLTSSPCVLQFLKLRIYQTFPQIPLTRLTDWQTDWWPNRKPLIHGTFLLNALVLERHIKTWKTEKWIYLFGMKLWSPVLWISEKIQWQKVPLLKSIALEILKCFW